MSHAKAVVYNYHTVTSLTDKHCEHVMYNTNA